MLPSKLDVILQATDGRYLPLSSRDRIVQEPSRAHKSQLPTLLPDIMCIYSTLLLTRTNVVPRQGCADVTKLSSVASSSCREELEEDPSLNGLTLTWSRDSWRPPHLPCLLSTYSLPLSPSRIFTAYSRLPRITHIYSSRLPNSQTDFLADGKL